MIGLFRRWLGYLRPVNPAAAWQEGAQARMETLKRLQAKGLRKEAIERLLLEHEQGKIRKEFESLCGPQLVELERKAR